ncbi:MAG: hypothetical protein JJU29_03555 [Verrucomicrobia bacterium]|nr:hypothetical protein [Verrucomicrobiota bacterium]MCH8511060.1 hypothetical protein [Kiritimatiellia bacterium]
MMTRLAEFFADYEAWVLPRAGLAFREKSVNAWHRNTHAIPADEMSMTWRGMAEEFRRLSWEMS